SVRIGPREADGDRGCRDGGGGVTGPGEAARGERGAVQDGQGASAAEVVRNVDGRRSGRGGRWRQEPAGVGGVWACAAGGECAAAVRGVRGRGGVDAGSEVCGGAAAGTAERAQRTGVLSARV